MKEIFLGVFLTLIMLVGSAGATSVITLSQPANNSYSSTAQEFTFTPAGNETQYLCELFINGTEYGINRSTKNNTLTNITANDTITAGVSDWYINCTNGTVTNQSEIRTFGIAQAGLCRNHTVIFSLDSDFSYINGSCITIGADSITINCQGYSITGNKSGSGINITGQENIILQNCSEISNFSYNFFINNATNLLIKNQSSIDIYFYSIQKFDFHSYGDCRLGFHNARIRSENLKNCSFILKSTGRRVSVQSYFSGKIPRQFVYAAGFLAASFLALLVWYYRRRRR